LCKRIASDSNACCYPQMCQHLLESTSSGQLFAHLQQSISRVVGAGRNGLRALIRFLTASCKRIAPGKAEQQYAGSERQFANRVLVSDMTTDTHFSTQALEISSYASLLLNLWVH
jgi:hypothetical protein